MATVAEPRKAPTRKAPTRRPATVNRIEVQLITEQQADGWWQARAYHGEDGPLLVLTPLTETEEEARELARLMWHHSALALPVEMKGTWGHA